MFLLLGISISVFLQFLLFIKKNKSRADKILAVWLVLIFVHQLLNYLQDTGELYKYPHTLGVSLAMPILHGVLLFFYVLELTGNQFKNKITYYLHLIPTVLLVLLAIPFYKLTGSEKIFVYENDGSGFEWYVMINQTAMILSGLTYTAWSLYLIKKHGKKIQENFSNTDKKELQWLLYLTIGLGLIWLLAFFAPDGYVFYGVVVFVLFIGFFGINQLNIFNTQNQNSSESSGKIPTGGQANNNIVNKRYAKSGLNEQMAEQLYSNLNNLLSSDSFYKESDLTLSELAKRLEVHSNHLSQVINEKEGKNFYNYINTLRVKEFIRLSSLPESKKFTLLSLAFDCGFSSKSTFNKHFKEFTQKTPSEFFSSQNAE
jgi:AraC-like DNA-binding protein